MNSRSFGADGEERAAEFLRTKGYQILKRNFRSKRGEVDIICEAAETVVYVEVKRWTFNTAASLEYSIGRTKQRRIADAARLFLLQEPAFRGWRQRFDIVFLYGVDGRIEHIEGAFESPWPG
ncbi:MAG: YraN family protein [Alkalispirochaeta sp.]